MKKNNSGFTLAEVLITLGIIGVVAALTIPTLLQNAQDAQYKTAYKKAYSVANNAFRMAIAQGEEFVEMTSASDGVDACINWQIFSAQFKKTKECVNNDTSKCWTGGETSNGAPVANSYAFIDSSGVAWSMRGYCSSTITDNSIFMVDTNGLQNPNMFGKDRWVFTWSLTNGIPIKITTRSTDYGAGVTNPSYCPSGGCYYNSWLFQ